jgi:dTDP-4-amino-4,6-dideoxygalactose transaminase
MTHWLVPWAKPYFGQEEIDLLMETARSGWMSQGARVRALEERVGTLTDCGHCVAVNSGTAALDVALKLMDVGPGDEVIVPAFAYIASANAILYQGATPVFADVEPETLNLDPKAAERQVTDRTKGIIALDYGGHGADWQTLRALARERGLFLVEDAAPAFGGAYRGRALGTMGDVGITSFHTAKIFTCIEGGMVFCRDGEQAEHARMIRSQGESPKAKYVHHVLGHNYRLSDVHAAVGLAQLGRYDEVRHRRAEAAAYYTERLSTVEGVRVPLVLSGHRHAWFLYSVRVPTRDAVRRRLAEAGIETNVSWPQPVYEQDPYKRFFRETCPVAEETCRSVLGLPLYFELKRDDQDLVVASLARALETRR